MGYERRVDGDLCRVLCSLFAAHIRPAKSEINLSFSPFRHIFMSSRSSPLSVVFSFTALSSSSSLSGSSQSRLVTAETLPKICHTNKGPRLHENLGSFRSIESCIVGNGQCRLRDGAVSAIV